MADFIIQFKNVYKALGDQPVLRGLSLDIERGKVTVIIGRSGVGKTVLLKHVLGLTEADQGAVLVEGQDVMKMGRRARRALKSRFSFMFQQMALLDSMTAYKNIALPLNERTKLTSGEIRGRVMALAESLELAGTLEKYPSELSGGMRKRVAFARALITEPEVVLFDEPTTGLDPVRKSMVHGMIAEHQRHKGFTAVVVSHDVPDVFEISQRVAMMDDGVIIAEGPTAEFRRSQDPRLRRFLEARYSPGRDEI